MFTRLRGNRIQHTIDSKSIVLKQRIIQKRFLDNKTSQPDTENKDRKISPVIILKQEIVMYYCRFFIILISIFCVVPDTNAEDIMVATDIWEDYTNKDGSGYYLDILRAAFPEPDFTLIIRYMPYKRALMLM